MSDFVPRETLPDLWEEILQTHWTFLETEESIQKLEERKKLEGCLKEFLCIVPHDRKFFLPETAHVLKKSIKEMPDFSAYKAMIGFESISQYANNLFTKPWRKEYRVIKMYSGFYQHEIKSNLIDADKLFEAMGYKQFSNQILMLDGPICPDQVTNVSRDAMAAYVECQIMKNIYSSLMSMQLSCSWLDIYNFREIHIGGITQAVKSMAYTIQERKYRKEKINSESCYSTIQAPSQIAAAAITSASCPSCSHTCQQQQQQQQFSNTCSIHQHIGTATIQPAPPSSQQTYSSVCSLHAPQQNIFMQQQNNVVPVPIHHYKVSSSSSYHSHPPPSQMSHSKSLEHYVDHVIPSSSVLPHRHSFDQPHYDTTAALMSTYDCPDGGGINSNGGVYQSCNLNSTYNHPYNVSGNRYPLPYNISAQLNNQLQSTSAGGGGGGGSGGSNCMAINSGIIGHHYSALPPTSILNYSGGSGAGNGGSSINNSHHKLIEHDHGECNNVGSGIYGKQNNSQKICNYHHMVTNGKDLINYRSHYHPQYNYNSNRINTDQLIDFDERPSNDCYQQQHNHHHRNHPHNLSSSSQNNSLDYTTNNERQKQILVNDQSHQQQHHHHHNHHQNLLASHYDIPRSSIAALKDLTVVGGSNSKSIEVIDINDGADSNYHHHHNKKLSSSTSAALRRSITEKYNRNAEILEQYQKVIDNNEQKSSIGCGTHDSCDSYEEIIGGGGGGTTSGGSITADGCCSDSIQIQNQQQPVTIKSSTTKNLNKNQDGVGSFESWDYVFQNLEKHGYNKDLGERGDLLVQGLNLDLMNINGAIDKRRSRNLNLTENVAPTTKPSSSSTIIRQQATVSTGVGTSSDKMKSSESNKKLQDSLSSTVAATISKQNSTTSTSSNKESKGVAIVAGVGSSSKTNENIVMKKSSLQHSSNQQVSKAQQAQNQPQKSSIKNITSSLVNQSSSSSSPSLSSSSKTNTTATIHTTNNNNINNNLNDERSTLHRLSSNGILVAAHCQQQNNTGTNGTTGGGPSSNGSVTTGTGTAIGVIVSTSSTSAATTTQQIKCGPNEWSCRFCTYLNPDTKRICEMCCRSKDFILDTTNAPTCV